MSEYIIGSLHCNALYYMEESTRGTFEAPGAATDAKWIAQYATMFYREDMDQVIQMIAGGFDPNAIIDRGKAYSFTLAFSPVLTHSVNFLKYAFLKPNGAGTSEKALSLCTKVSIAGTDYYIKVKYALLPQATIGFQRGPLACRVDILGKLEAFNTTAPTNWTLISDPGTVILNGEDGGATPFTVRDIATVTDYNPVVESAWFRIVNNISFAGLANTDTFTDAYVTAPRSRAAQLICSSKIKELRDIAQNKKYVNITYDIKSGTHQLVAGYGKFSGAILGYGDPGILSVPFNMVGSKTLTLS